MVENIYGQEKRLEFISKIISDSEIRYVLDIGCGTGENLTNQLALRFPNKFFIGIDSDAKSIAYANKENKLSNAQYFVDVSSSKFQAYDLIIASEVVEHVDDPCNFMWQLRSLLMPDGKLILTVPNGLGPFEIASLLEVIMHLTGIYLILRIIKRVIWSSEASQSKLDTLAVSPHINFFSYKKISSLISMTGFRILVYQPRTFLCGFGFDQLLQSSEIILWNAKVADYLPPQLVSAWMFLLTPSDEEISQVQIYKRRLLENFRRMLNEKRWGLR